MSQINQFEPMENGAEEEAPEKFRFITACYNITGIALSLTGVVLNTNRYCLTILILYPLLGIAIVLMAKGEIRFISNNKNKIYGSIQFGFLFASVFNFIQSLNNYTLFNNSNLWLPCFVISIIIVVSLFIAGNNPFEKKSRTEAIGILIIGLIYAYGCIRQINCAFDDSYPKIYHATILGRRPHHGRHYSSYIVLSPWGPMQEVNVEEVDDTLYYNASTGDTVKVNFKQGRLHIPWFNITKN